MDSIVWPPLTQRKCALLLTALPGPFTPRPAGGMVKPPSRKERLAQAKETFKSVQLYCEIGSMRGPLLWYHHSIQGLFFFDISLPSKQSCHPQDVNKAAPLPARLENKRSCHSHSSHLRSCGRDMQPMEKSDSCSFSMDEVLLKR